jgi:hypothetical protein
MIVFLALVTADQKKQISSVGLKRNSKELGQQLVISEESAEGIFHLWEEVTESCVIRSS